MKALAKTEEEFFSLDIGCIRILDAFRFFTALSLDVVAKTLGGNQRKGVYPYDWVDEKWEDKMKTTEFPPQETFYSKLKQEGIADEDYIKAKEVFDNNCKTFADYTIMYLKQDVKLLSDVFEKFRDKRINEYKIDSCNRYSSPGLSWICGSRFTEQRLKHYQKDTYDILLMIEKGIRGGIATILGDRYVKPWNRYTLPEHHKINKLCTLLHNTVFCSLTKENEAHQAQKDYLLYYDFNSLYPSCMVEDLPIGEFIKCNDLFYETTKDGDFGIIYEIKIKFNNDLKQKTEVPYFPLFSRKFNTIY